MSQKMGRVDTSRFRLNSSDATLIMGVVGFVCFMLGIFMGVML